MVKRPFNLEKYNEMYPKPEVETRNGMSARIICTDLDNEHYPVAAAVRDGEYESLHSYTRNGQLSWFSKGGADLFMLCRF